MHIANLENGEENGNGKVPTGKEVVISRDIKGVLIRINNRLLKTMWPVIDDETWYKHWRI